MSPLSRTENRGYFITLEGSDGSGKTTQMSLLKKFLERCGIDVYLTREPGGTHLGETLRNIILHHSDPIDDKVELLLLFAARSQHIAEVIKPRLANGQWVLSDRFTDATFAYQGGGRQMELSQIEALERIVQGQFRPDRTFLLDLPVEQGIQRLHHRAVDQDRIESQDLEFKKRVRCAYLDQHMQHKERIVLIDAVGSISAVHEIFKRDISVLIGSKK